MACTILAPQGNAKVRQFAKPLEKIEKNLIVYIVKGK
jgi:hypothetical protein